MRRETRIDCAFHASPRQPVYAKRRSQNPNNLKIGGSIPHRSVSNNLIEGRHDQVVAFLDQLTYGDGSMPETKETFAEWREVAQQVQRFRKGRSSKL